MITTLKNIIEFFKGLVANDKTQKADPNKLAVSTSYLVSTICFMWYHWFIFAESTPVDKVTVVVGYMPILWLIYLATIGGHHYLLDRLDKVSPKSKE